MVYPYTKRSEVGDKIRRFAYGVGIRDRLRSDLVPEIKGKHTEFQDQLKRLRIDPTHS